MTTRFLLLGSCLGVLATGASAQWSNASPSHSSEVLSRVTDARPGQTVIVDRGGEGDVVWSEDFSNGLAGSSSFGAWTREGAHGGIWVVNTNAPRGAYTTNNERITSSTASNGFAKFASDSANCTWSNGTPTVRPSGQVTAWDGSLASPWIDLSTTPQVELVFEQQSRWCCADSPFELDIITALGDTTTFLANEGLPVNQGAPGTNTPTAATETRRFNITSAIANDPGNVRIRFHHNGASRSTHYYWQVDDIRIAMLPEYERRMNFAYTVITDLGEEYGRIPQAQMPGAMNIGAEVMNYGGADQTDVSVTCVLRGPSGQEILEQTTNIGTLAMGDTAKSDDFINLPALATGRYEATFTVHSEQDALEGDTSDDSKKRHFEVTSSQFSLDALGNHPTGEERRSQLGTASFRNNSSFYVMTLYPITAETNALSATIILGPGSVAGSDAKIEVSLYNMSDILNIPAEVGFPIGGMTSDEVSLTSAHISAGRITIPLLSPVTLTPGNYYLSAKISGSGTADVTNDAEVFIVDDITVPQPGRGSMIYLPYDINDDGTDGRHIYGDGNASAIRLNITSPVGIAERNTSRIAMYPNPTNGILNIVSDDAGLMNVEVIDLIGATVRTATFADRTTLDLSGLSHGLYSVRVGNGKRTSVERITLH